MEGFGVPVDKDVAPRTENTSNNKGEDRKGSKRESRVRKSCSIVSVVQRFSGELNLEREEPALAPTAGNILPMEKELC